MNGPIIGGVVSIACAIFFWFGGYRFVPKWFWGPVGPGAIELILIGLGLGLIAYGAFGPSKSRGHSGLRRPSDSDRYV